MKYEKYKKNLRFYIYIFTNNIDIENTKKIASLCNVELIQNKNLLPIYDENINEYEYLTYLCNKGLKRRLNNKVTKEYQDRLDYELSIINKMNFCNI